MSVLKTLEGISDGKLYDVKDRVNADAGGCYGCSACCHNVGDLVVLTPFDVYEMCHALKQSFDELLLEHIKLRRQDKIWLPYLEMKGNHHCCSFLNSQDRCSIHAHRPNICRLFPLGRIYQKDTFKYFLQVNSCLKTPLKSVKIEDWIGVREYERNKAFILKWHHLLKALAFRLKFATTEECEEKTQYLLDTFYRTLTATEDDFYLSFENSLSSAKNDLGVI